MASSCSVQARSLIDLALRISCGLGFTNIQRASAEVAAGAIFCQSGACGGGWVVALFGRCFDNRQGRFKVTHARPAIPHVQIESKQRRRGLGDASGRIQRREADVE